MWLNIVPLTFLQRALRVLLGSLFLAVAWIFASAAASFASDLSSLVSDTTSTVQESAPASLDAGLSPTEELLNRAVFQQSVPQRSVSQRSDSRPAAVQSLPKPAEAAGAVANGAAAVSGQASQTVARASAPADGSLDTVETGTRNLTSTAASVTPTVVQAISKPIAAVVHSVVHDAVTAVKPVLTKVASLPARVVGDVVPDVVVVPALPAVAAEPALEPVSGATEHIASASRSAFAAEQGNGEESSPAGFPGRQFVGVPAVSAKQSGMAAPDPVGRPANPSSPSPTGAAGSANSGGMASQQLAGTTDSFAVPFNAASELRTRSSGPDPQALNRHPGFSPD